MGHSTTPRGRRRAPTIAERVAAIPGARILPSGAFQLRQSFPGVGRQERSVRSIDDLEALARRWDDQRARGENPTMTDHAARTIGADAQRHYDLRRTTPSDRTGRMLAPGSLRVLEIATRPWREGPYAAVAWARLDVARLEADHRRAALDAPKMANDRLAALKNTAHWALKDGAPVPPALFEVRPVKLDDPEPFAFTMPELLHFVAAFPPRMRRHVLVVFLLGLRIRESFTLEDAEVGWADGSVTVPAEKCKEHRTKTLYAPDRATVMRLLAEQVGRPHPVGAPSLLDTRSLPRRPAATISGMFGTPLVFPAARGGQWRYSDFRRYWDDAREKAAAAWNAEHGHPADAATKFDAVTPHKLRSSIATLLMDEGIAASHVAGLLGHKDGGKVLLRHYDAGKAAERARDAFDQHLPAGLLGTVEVSGAPHSDAPDAADGTP